MSTFRTIFSALRHRDGSPVQVLRPLTDDEADLEETGPMYLVQFSDGQTACVFADELTPVPTTTTTNV